MVKAEIVGIATRGLVMNIQVRLFLNEKGQTPQPITQEVLTIPKTEDPEYIKNIANSLAINMENQIAQDNAIWEDVK